MNNLNEILKAFLADKVNLKDVPATDPIAAHGRMCEALFTGGIDTLQSGIPNERIRAIGRLLWDLVGNKQVLVVIGVCVPSLTFTAMRKDGGVQGMVLIPIDWPTMVADDPVMQLSALLFVGSQVVDSYNERLIEDAGALARCLAYEAELTRSIQQISSTWTPNEYQREVLAKYPDGLDTPGVQLYTYRPFEAPREIT